MMFLGTKMTPAAAQVLKLRGIPQAVAVCIPVDLWDSVHLRDITVDASCLVMQQLHDLNDYVSDGRGDCSAIADIASVSFRWGIVHELHSKSGRRVEGMENVVSWLNKALRDRQAPRVGVREDGLCLRVDIGDATLAPVTFEHAQGHLGTKYLTADQLHADKMLHRRLVMGITEEMDREEGAVLYGDGSSLGLPYHPRVGKVPDWAH